MAGGGSEPGRSVLSKALALLAAFETGPRSMSLTALAEATGLPLTTVHRLVGELEAWGALSRDPQGRYQVGLRLWELAQHAGRALRDTVRPYLQDLFSLTGETAHIAIRDGTDVLYIDRVYGSRRVPRASRVGGRLPMHATAVGKVLLAFETPEVREAYLGRALERRTVHTHIDPELLALELAAIAERGFATTNEEVRAGSCSIAVPVMHTGRIGASIGLVMHSAQAASMAQHVPVLRGTADRIERATAHIPLETLITAGGEQRRRSRGQR